MALTQDELRQLNESIRADDHLSPDEVRARYRRADAQWNPKEGVWEWLGDTAADLTVADEMKWLVPCLPWTLVKVRDEPEYERSVYRRLESES